MKKSGKIVRRIVAVVLSFTLIWGEALSTTAASYTQKTALCPKCHQSNKSYGYDSDFASTTVSVNSGNYCAGCGEIVPDGESHMYLYTSDKYFFMCTSTSCSKLDVPDRVYTYLYDNAVSEHYTNGVKDN